MNLKFQPFAPDAVQLGGEIRRRMELTAAKILHHLDVENVFVRHFRHRSEMPDVPGGFTGYGMFLDALVKAAMHRIGGELNAGRQTPHGDHPRSAPRCQVAFAGF